MSKTSFQVDRELNVTGKGTLTNAARIIGNLNLGSILTGSIGAYQNIDREYKKAISNDGKIVGKERTDILLQIDTFLDMLFILIRALDVDRLRVKETNFLLENRHSGFRLQVREKNNIWNAEGKLNVFMTHPVKNFRDIYNNKLAPEIIDLLKKYGKASEDGVIDVKEMDELRKGAKQVIYYTLFLRFQVEKCLINS